MRNLTLDTSSEHLLLILSSESMVLDTKIFPHCHNLSSTLIPAIQQLCKKNSTPLSLLTKLFIGIGPGSYTGTRVGVAVASNLALALSIPLIPFCSLLAFIPPGLSEGPFLFLSAAKQPPHFLLQGIIENGQINPLTTHLALKTEELPLALINVSSCITLNPSPSHSQLPEDFPIFWHQGQLNPDLLISYFSLAALSPTDHPKIIYHHNFSLSASDT